MSDNEEISNIKARHLFVINKSISGSNQPACETPESIHLVYNFNKCYQGAGVIAIISAFNYPTALTDFNIFSKQFGLPVETSTNELLATNKVFQVINARGVPPALDAGWAMESALDIQWAHAMAPHAKIVLVQASSNTFIDLFQAVDVANAIPNVKAVSMSWGGAEFSGETAFDTHLKKAGVVYVTGSGDIGGQTIYPSVSQYVLSVGGTKINRNACGKYTSETGWVNGGGGPSLFVPIPSYQAGHKYVAEKTGAYRATPDVAFDADMSSGVAIYDSTPYQGISGWIVIGGTSLAAPCWAGVVSCLSSKGRQFTSTADFQMFLYNTAGKTKYTNHCCCFRDIIKGKAGNYSAEPGYDFVTGLGTPIISNLIKKDSLACKLKKVFQCMGNIFKKDK